MKILLLILQFICHGVVLCKKIPVEKINGILKDLSYSKLEKTLSEFRKNKSCGIWREYHREILVDYKEGYFEVQNIFPKNLMRSPDFEDSTYVIKLVTKGNKIIFYEFCRKKYKFFDGRTISYLEFNYGY